MDNTAYKTGVDTDITNKITPRSIPATVVGGKLKDLADLTEVAVNQNTSDIAVLTPKIDAIVSVLDVSTEAKGLYDTAKDGGNTSGTLGTMYVQAGQIFDISGKTNELKVQGAVAGEITIVQLRKTSGFFNDVARMVVNIVVGSNTIDLTAFNNNTLSGDCFGIEISGAGRIVRKAGLANDVTFTSATPTGGHYNIPENQINVTGTVPNNALAYQITISSNAVNQNTSDIAVLTQRVNDITNTGKKSQGTVLHDNTFTSITSDWISNTWGVVSGGVSPSGTGLLNTLVLNKQYSLDKRSGKCRVRLFASTRFMLMTVNKEDNATLCTISEIDVAAGKIRIYNAYNSTNVLPAIKTEIAMAFPLDADCLMELYVDKNTFSNVVRVTNTKTGEVVSLEDTTNTTGRMHDCYAMCCYSGTAPIVKSFHVNTPYSNPYVMCIGDSITEAMGNGVLSVNGYAQQIVGLANGNGCVSGRGGGRISGVIERLETEVAFLLPTYLSITIGTNAGNSLSLLRQVIARVKSLGVVPILNNIPKRYAVPSANAYVNGLNADIATVRGENFLQGMLFDVATSIDNDPANDADPAKFYPDGVHPINFGGGNTPFMTQRANIDAPNILY